MSVWDNQLEYLESSRILVEVLRDTTDKDETIIGIISQRSAEFVALQEVSGDAEYDGLEIIPVEDITRLRWGNRELKSIQKLMTLGATMIPEMPSLNIDSLGEALASVHEVFGYVGVHLDDMNAGYLIGEVLEQDDDRFLLHAYSSKASIERFHTMVAMAGVCRIEVDGKYERRILSLFDNEKM